MYLVPRGCTATFHATLMPVVFQTNIVNLVFGAPCALQSQCARQWDDLPSDVCHSLDALAKCHILFSRSTTASKRGPL